MKFKLILALFFPVLSYAQPFNFRSTNTAKPIELTLSWHNMGKGASVLYKGKTQLIALKLKSYDRDTSDRAIRQPDIDTYKWLEVYQGKVTGEYGVTVMLRNIDDMYYIRYSDRKKFKFEYAPDDKPYDGKNLAFLHETAFHFNNDQPNTLQILYKSGLTKNFLLDAPPADLSRYCMILDYNFDGFDDIAFAHPTPQFVNTISNVFIYQPKTKTFERLSLPKGETENGYNLYNIKTLPKQKKLAIAYQKDAKWLYHNYQFNQQGQLVRLKD